MADFCVAATCSCNVSGFGFVSVELGEVLFRVSQQGSFKAEDLIACLYDIRKKHGQGELVFFGDNSRVHRNRRVFEAAAALNVLLLWNAPWRPDLNGIERVWRDCKRVYRQEVARLHINQRRINNLAVVKGVIRQLSNDSIKREAAAGWQRLLQAQPVEYEPRESSSEEEEEAEAEEAEQQSSEEEEAEEV